MNRKASRRVIARTVATKILAEPARQAYWLRATAAYLLEHRMENDAELIINDIAHELFKQAGHLLVDVTSARALSQDVRDALQRTLREATGAKHVEFVEHTNPSLLGGFVARTPDAVLDASIRTALKQLATL